MSYSGARSVCCGRVGERSSARFSLHGAAVSIELIVDWVVERCEHVCRPYMNTAPLAVRKEMSAARVHRTFVTLGMRHLCVVNSHNHVCGIITRKDLMHAAEHGVAEHNGSTGGGGGAGTSTAPSQNGAANGASRSEGGGIQEVDNEVSDAFLVPDLPSASDEAPRGTNGRADGGRRTNGESHAVTRRR